MFLKNEKISLDVSNNGQYSIIVDQFNLSLCQLKVEIDDLDCTPRIWQSKKINDGEIQLTAENTFGYWIAEFSLNETTLSIKLSGKLNEKKRVVKLYVLNLSELTADHLLSQGAKMGGCKSLSTFNHPKESFDGYHVLIITANKMHLRLAFPLHHSQPTQFDGYVDNGRIENLNAYSEILHFDDLDIQTNPMQISFSSDGIQLLQDYGEDNILLEKDFSKGVEAGWNSWDYYRWTITEEEVLKNAEFIASDPILSKHIKRIIVDDGWQYCYGEWEPNHYFPNGMEYLAKELKKMGFKPGLWFAPTIIEPHARIAQLDYDMLAMGESGEPCLGYSCMERYGFLLDPTQSKVQEHLYNLFRRYADMGYEYFKLDFMATTLNARKFADSTISRSKIQELIVKPIHDAVHGKAEILGCNYLFEAGNKYVNAVRVGSDIHAYWDSLKLNTVAVASRFWANKKLWINDPDFALCRGFDTINDPDFTRLKASLVNISPEMKKAGNYTSAYLDMKRPQLEILLSIVLAAGGSVNLSDNMLRLNDSGLDLARRAVSAESCSAAIPLDLFKNELPSYWLQTGKYSSRALLINWTDKTEERILNLKQYDIQKNIVVNFWNDTEIKIKNGTIVKVLEPRSCLMVKW